MDQAQANAHVQFVYDLTACRVVFVNEAYGPILGGDPAQVNDELPDLLQRLHPDDRDYLTQYWRLWTQGHMKNEVEVRLHLEKPDQTDAYQWFCLSPYHQPAPNGQVLVGGTLRDISATKHYKQNADAFNIRKNFTLEILSHDLSGTFIMVQQIAQYLREELTVPLDGHIGEMLRVLETTSQDGVTMIRNMVELEFLASANSDLKRDRVEIGATLREPLEEMQRRQNLLGHRFTYALPADPVYVELDVNKFVQVLINLVSNAIKFTPDGGKVELRVEAAADKVHIHVMDTGIGIPLAMQPLLFERFTKARRPGLRGEVTTGLGLILCKTIVEWHQGTIHVVSAEGKGSTFTVELPQATIGAEREDPGATHP